MSKYSMQIARAVEEARRDLHVNELHNQYLQVLDSMSQYLDTAERIQEWMHLEKAAKSAYDEAAFEAYCVGKRLECQLLGQPSTSD